MRSSRSRAVGPRGITVLAVTGIVGVLLAVHGWAHYNTIGPLGSLGASSTTTRLPAGTGPPTAAPATSRSPTSAPAAGSPTHSGTAASSPGPLLKSQPFAAYAFSIWPGTPTSVAQAALTGLSISVHRQGAGLSVTASVNGQPPGAAHFYPGGAEVYVVEASMGDDSGSSDYNLGDDGLVVTDTHGRIVS